MAALFDVLVFVQDQRGAGCRAGELGAIKQVKTQLGVQRLLTASEAEGARPLRCSIGVPVSETCSVPEVAHLVMTNIWRLRRIAGHVRNAGRALHVSAPSINGLVRIVEVLMEKDDSHIQNV